MQTSIDRIETHAKKIASGKHETVSPGQPARFTEASSVNDGIWQGDLGLEIIEKVPDGYTLVRRAKDADRQLVPGNTQGSKHCLDSLSGVKLYRPEKWDGESLIGPCFVLTEERTVQHPTHGAVTIPAGFTVQCRYQREFDAELRRERRNAD